MAGIEPARFIQPQDFKSCASASSATAAYKMNRDNLLSRNGTNRARTYDPLLVRQMLSQLSYDPIQTTQKRLELSTSAVTGRRSNQLSHWAIFCCTYVPSKLHTRNIFFHPTYHLAWSCPRPISISQLHTLLYFHL